MTQEALKKMYQLLLTEPHAPTVCAQLERIAREALADHAMRETQRLGQEIEPDDIASILACREMLDAQPVPEVDRVIWPEHTEQEPVAWWNDTGTHIDLNVSGRGAPLYTAPPQRTWVGLMRGVRVDGDTVVITVRGGNDAARELCGELLKEKNT